MDAQIWLIIAIVGFSLAVIALITAIVMFIKLKIPAVIGDLSGKTVAREIKAMRDANASSGNKIHRPSGVNANRGKLTEKVKDDVVDGSIRAAAHVSKRLDITNSGQSAKLKNSKTAEQVSAKPSKGKTTENLSSNVNEVDIAKHRATDILAQNKATDVLSNVGATEVLPESQQTEVLTDARETEILSDSQATEVLTETKQTEVLSDNNSAFVGSLETTVLTEAEEMLQNNVSPVAFNITRSIVKTHTEEEI